MPAILLCPAAYAEVFSISTPPQNGVIVTTTLDTRLHRLTYSLDLSSLDYDYEQIAFSPAPLPAFDAIPLQAGAVSSPGLTEWNFHQISGSSNWQLECQYLTGSPPPKNNHITITYLADTAVTGGFAGQAGDDNLEVTLRRPPEGFPPGQDDHITLWAYTPEVATEPSVSLVRPPSGATVSDTVIVQAVSEDPSSINAMLFFVRNTDTGAVRLLRRDDVAPFRLRWNTLGVANGPYRIYANAEDIYGNRKTSSRTVTVFN